MIYQLVTSTTKPHVKVDLKVTPPDGFRDWSETERDEYMLLCAANALARQIGHRPQFLDFDYFELHEPISAG